MQSCNQIGLSSLAPLTMNDLPKRCPSSMAWRLSNCRIHCGSEGARIHGEFPSWLISRFMARRRCIRQFAVGR